MSHFDILLPFGLPQPEIAPDLLRALATPALSTLLARAKTPVSQAFDSFSRAMPHEIWLAGRLGLTAGRSAAENSPALATRRMNSLHLTAPAGTWFLLQPAHIHIGRTSLVLTDMRRTQLAEPDSRALFDTAQPLFQEAGKALLYGNADTWFVRADDWRCLHTATPDAACGRSIDSWLPKGEGERAWHKLQNEVQMAWHEHAVNLARAERRLPAVNSLWLWGGADADLKLADDPAGASREGLPAAWAGTASASGTVPEFVSASPDHRLQVLDNLSESALAEDWANWLDGMHALEAMWFAPLLSALRAGKIGQIKLIAGHRTQLREFTVPRHALLKLWTKPSLSRLLP